DDVAARVVARLDALASTWVARYTAICERHRVGELSDEGLDRRMACLDERHGALRAVVDVLGTADADAVEKAVETAASVPAIDRCDDPTYLAASVRSPEDPATAAEVSRIQDSLAQARALILAGRYADGVERASAAVEEARAVAYAPLLAEALLVLGLGRVDLGEYQPAGELLADAYWRALGEGVDVVAAKAAARLAYLHGAQLLDFDAGRQWGRHGEALVRRLGDDRELAAELATSRGSVEVRARQLDAAAEHFTRAIELIDDGEAQPHPHLGRFHNNLAVVHAMRQRWADSERESRLARELMERTLGPGHPLLAHPHTNLGNALKEQGRFDEALALHRRALEIHERAAGPEHPGVAAFLINLAAVQRHKRDYDDAIATLGRALRVREAAFGPEHPQVANVHINLGDAHLQRGDYEEAARAYRRALEIRERAFGAEHEFLVIVLSGLGRAALELGDTREAIAQLERALALAGDATERKERAEARFGLARALHITGRTPERVAELAKGALEDFGSYGEGYRAEMDELARWQASPEAFERARAERVVQE
ncbi:MAG: tetratricopeptide repeat protein, partial [Myxococcales bacterium]|nr:tetratricopeptide repeat protein [Myxococcales bacterium]